MNPSTRWTAALAVAAGSLLCGGLAAQTFRAHVTGVAVDQGGAVVPGVQVRATNLATGVTLGAVSNERGIYSLPNLEPGQYRIQAEANGFKTFVRQPVTLQVADVVSLDVALELGQVTEQVTVSGDAVFLETESAALGQVITQRNLQELPLNVKDPMALIALTAGVTVGRDFGQGGGSRNLGRNYFKADFNVGGGRMEAQEILLDGAPNTVGDRSFVAYIPPVESTLEFKVQSNAYSAEFGRTTGAVINIVTKSGTNQFQGIAYEYLRNSVLDANGFFANRASLPKTSARRHQLGFNARGPAIKNRTFFFGAFEGLRQTSSSTLVSTVPTARWKAGDFSQTLTSAGTLIAIYDPMTLVRQPNGTLVRSPFPGNAIPSNRLDPVAAAAMRFYPEPNQPGDPLTGANNLVSSDPDVNDWNKYDARVDHNVSEANRVFGRYSFQKSVRSIPSRWDGPAAPDARTLVDQFYNITFGDVHTFSPTLTGELRASFARAHANQIPRSLGFDLKQLKYPQNLTAIAHSVFPTFNISDATGMGQQRINNQPRNTYALLGNVGKFSGRHTMKAGFDVRIIEFNAFQIVHPAGQFSFGRNFTQGPDPLRARADAGFGSASFLLGMGTGGSMDHINGLSLRRWYYAGYFQDDVKITPRLTVNVGLRYDLTTGQTERYNRLTWMDLAAVNPLAQRTGMPLRGVLRFLGVDGNSRNQLATDRNNWGPRIGLAYQLPGETVVRAGYGIYYVPMITRDHGSLGFNTSTPWVSTIDGLVPENLMSNPFPQGFNLPRGDRDPLTNVGFGISGYIHGEPVGYTQQWSLSVQRKLGANTIVDLAYGGSKGTKLQFGEGFEENFLPNRYLSMGTALNDRVPNPFAGIIATGQLSGATVARRQLLLPYPQYTSVSRDLPMAGSSIYHAFSAKFERRIASGLSVLASYTISKSIDDSSGQTNGLDQSGGILDMENRRLERSVSAFDIPRQLIASYVYELPVGKGKAIGAHLHPVWNALAGGWTVAGISSFQSGFPIAITRPSVNNGRSARLENPTIDRWFDTSVFSTALPFTFGNVGRLLPDVRDDGMANFDFTIGKSFPIRERFRLQFRTELFNAFNTPRFAAPVGSITNRSFGTVNEQLNTAREIQMALKLYW